jgi:O-antigen/teichoic acid export membrane protein
MKPWVGKTSQPFDLRRERLWQMGGEFFWVAVGQLVAASGSIIGVRLLTSSLDPSRYGELALGITVATLVQQLVMGPLVQASLRYFSPATETGRLGAYIQALARWLGRATVVMVAVAVLVASMGLVVRTGLWRGLVLSALAFSLVSGYSAVVEGVQTAARQRVLVAWHQGLSQWLRPVFAVAMVGLMGRSSTAAMLGFVAAAGATLLSQTAFLAPRLLKSRALIDAPSPKEVQDYVRLLGGYAWPFSTWGGLTWLQTASDRWALQLFRGPGTVGIYAATYQLGYYPVILLSNALVQLVSPVIFSRAGDGTEVARLRRALALGEMLVAGSLVMTMIATATAALFRRWLFPLLVAAAYRDSSLLMPWLIFAGGLFASGQAAALMLMTAANSQALVAPKVVTAALGVLLNVAGAYWLGIRGVVLANILFAAAHFLWTYLLARQFRDRLDGRT